MKDIFKYTYTKKCLICNKSIGLDDWLWHGLDGDKIHKKCKKNEQTFYNKINNMTNEEFSNWLF